MTRKFYIKSIIIISIYNMNTIYFLSVYQVHTYKGKHPYTDLIVHPNLSGCSRKLLLVPTGLTSNVSSPVSEALMVRWRRGICAQVYLHLPS